MKKLLFLFLLLVELKVCFAQSRFPYSINRYRGHYNSYFTDGEEIYPLRTIASQAKNSYNTANQLHSKIHNCSIDSAAWFAHIISTFYGRMDILDGFEINYLNDAVVKEFADGNKLKENISKPYWDNYLNRSDSLKKITFYREQETNKPDQLVYDSLYFIVSKNDGLIETRLRNYKFQNGLLDTIADNSGRKVWLVGEQGIAGWQYLTDSAIFNFNVGDEFHYKEINRYSHTIPTANDHDKNIALTVLEKKVKNDSVIYSFKRKQERISRSMSPSPVQFTEDTVVYAYSYSKEVKNINKWEKTNNSPDSLVLRYFKYKEGDSVLYEKGRQCSLNYPVSSKKVEGLGEVDMSYQTGWGGNISKNLVYFKKGSKEWGKPLLLNVEDQENFANASFSVSPNPASGNVVVFTTFKNTDLELYNLSGTLVQKEYSSSNKDINVSHLNPGIYIYHIKSGDKLLKSGKLVIE